MKISVKMDGLDALQARMRGLADKKIKVAAVAALNDAAYVGYSEVRKEIQKVFDRATPWVLGGVTYKKAGQAGASVRVAGAFDIKGGKLSQTLTSDRLEAVIDFTGNANKQGIQVDKILSAQISGGPRRHKRHEKALQSAGILPPGMFIVPGGAAEIDQYGGMKGSQIVQILSWFSAMREAGSRSNMTDATRDKRRKGTKKTQGFEFFYVAPGSRRSYQSANGKQGTHKMQPGIYKRMFTTYGNAIRPVMIFVKSPNYKKRLDFYGVAERKAVETFNKAFPMYLDKLLKERGL